MEREGNRGERWVGKRERENGKLDLARVTIPWRNNVIGNSRSFISGISRNYQRARVVFEW